MKFSSLSLSRFWRVRRPLAGGIYGANSSRNEILRLRRDSSEFAASSPRDNSLAENRRLARGIRIMATLYAVMERAALARSERIILRLRGEIARLVRIPSAQSHVRRQDSQPLSRLRIGLGCLLTANSGVASRSCRRYFRLVSLIRSPLDKDIEREGEIVAELKATADGTGGSLSERVKCRKQTTSLFFSCFISP